MQYYVRRNDNQLDAYDFATGAPSLMQYGKKITQLSPMPTT
jgi:hypothetical protein